MQPGQNANNTLTNAAYPRQEESLLKIEPSPLENKAFSFDKMNSLEPQASSESLISKPNSHGKSFALLDKNLNSGGGSANLLKKLKEQQIGQK